MDRIGLVAGNGNMPSEVVERCAAHGLEVFVVGLRGFVDEVKFVAKFSAGGEFAGVPHVFVRLGQVGRMVDFLRSNGVREVTMAGGTPRVEALREIRRHGLDRTALWMLFRLGWKLLTKGNAAVFKAVLAQADRLGLRIVGVQDVLPQMVVGEGVMTAAKPSEADMADIRVGIEAALDLGRRDIGQAVAVRDGVVLATEDARGTDAALRRAVYVREGAGATLRSEHECAASGHDDKVRRPVMVKFPAPGQDLRVDFPAIGTDTVEALARNGFAGVAVEAGGALVIDRQGVIAAADKAGVFIIGMKR